MEAILDEAFNEYSRDMEFEVTFTAESATAPEEEH